MGQYQSITIKKAMANIVSNKYLLPAIQRKFVWNIEQIEILFDSILRKYPISSFMLWEITDNTIKQNYKFYSFIKDFVQKFHEDNSDVATSLLDSSFYAVIDGQQRLTSLYIGLKGSYKVKNPSKWWKNTEAETSMSKKKLYLELTEPISSNIDNEKYYNFKFLDGDEIKKDRIEHPQHFWFLVGDILKFEESGDVNLFLFNNGLADNKFAIKTLTDLYNVLAESDTVNYYLVEDQDQDKVLDIFIRTNSGGTPLSFSDLLMSISSANWKEFNARDEMAETKKSIYAFGNPCFDVTQDFILKSILVLSDADVRFKISNFGKNNVSRFETNWKRIKSTLVSTFNLLADLGFNDTLLRSKNAVIPIAYYIYKHNLEDIICKLNYNAVDKQKIYKWLVLTLLKGIFGGTSDGVLKNIRDVINHSNSPEFPIEDIINFFKGNPSKNYTFDKDIIEDFISAQYGTAECSLVLRLLYPNVVLEHGRSIAEDHMHPKSFFEKEFTSWANSLKDDEKEKLESNEKYYKKEFWNSVLNLQLLETTANILKDNTPLADWVKEKNVSCNSLYVNEKTGLDIIDFGDFIESRKKNLLDKIEQLVKI